MKILGGRCEEEDIGPTLDFSSISDNDKEEIATMIFQEALKSVICGASEQDGHTVDAFTC